VTDQREITVGVNNDESLMITGDENIVDLEFKVLYVIKPEGGLSDFLFEIEDPNETVKATAESVVREVIGMNELDDIITTERAELIATVRQQLQTLLDEYQAGVEVVDVQFQKTDPPEGEVLEAFDRVVASAQEAEAEVNQARAEFNKVTLEAEGRAAAILQEAEAYRDQVIAISQGEAERFLAVYEEYRKAPEVTRRRIYLETLEDVYRDADKVILDGDAGSGAVPYLPLNELNRGASQ
jgi:membrane protease subunit HflK